MMKSIKGYQQLISGVIHCSIKNLIKEDPKQKFDFIFMDADKSAYITYYNLIMDNDLLSDHGAIICDNGKCLK